MGLLVYGSEGWMRLGFKDWATFFGPENEPGPRMNEQEASAQGGPQKPARLRRLSSPVKLH